MSEQAIIDNMEVKITPGLYKEKERVWLIDFNGKEFTLYKVGEEWFQGMQDDLTSEQVIAIGQKIDDLKLEQQYA